MNSTKVKRNYDSSGRRQTAASTRSSVLSAARRLFLTRGYASTTVADIAARAKVAVDTVYASVGTKQAVFQALLESALSGTEQAVPAEQRAYVRAIRATSHAQHKLALYAQAISAIHKQLAPLFRVLRDASPTDKTLAKLWRTISERRARNMRVFAAELAATGQLRPELEPGELADVLWAMNSPDLYLLLVQERGWSGEQFEVWLRDALQRLFLATGE